MAEPEARRGGARRLAWGAAGLVLLLAVATASFSVGKFPLAPAELWASLLARLSGAASPLPPAAEAVIWSVRGPRVLAAALVGAALGAAGAAFQAMFRNPLVSPDILGVSAGCGLGAAVAILLGLPVALISGAAFGGGLLAVAVVMLAARRVGEHEPVLVLVLAGVAVGALLGAGISLVKLLADPSVQLPAITFWLLGGLNAVTPADLYFAWPWLAAGALVLVLARWRINLLSLPDDEAAALGARVGPLRAAVVAGATLMTASAVALSGIVGWVGLVVPHVARLLVGPEFSRLLPVAMGLGAAFLMLADTLARTLAAIELPLSVLTAGVGAPFFLWLLGRRRRPA
ncbi:FecCD family ABC transporter permease [Piscinibacter sp.]|uniref:FecCD family ABC transporter permease n=1 Tax=Piscinibacter sp. TaxID=1903157 RepID=UPI0039E5C048